MTVLRSAVTAVEHATRLLAEARRTNERRLLALSGEHSRCVEACRSVLSAVDVGITDAVAIGESGSLRCECLSPDRSTCLMGTTRSIVVVDLHAGTVPNVIGRATGAVDGGGLLVLLCPPFDAWPDRRDAFDEGLVVAPYTMEDVRGTFKRRLVTTLSDHPGVAVVDVDAGEMLRRGLTEGTRATPPEPPGAPPASTGFPDACYERCLTADQRRVLHAFERLHDPGQAVVVSAERGRGKSSAAGLAGGSFAVDGATVTVTAPAPQNTKALFARVQEVIGDLEGRAIDPDSVTEPIETDAGGEIRYLPPLDAVETVEVGKTDVLFVDEAAGLPVVTLEQLLAADRVAFTTTRHGYEGAGHGFGVRFRESIESARHAVTELQMETPIRYAPHDPIESWANRTFLLDARSPVATVVEEATPASVDYDRLSPDDLASDESRLREIVGLLAMAHYRTEPDDLARVLDAPNLEIGILAEGGHIASVALLAREGGLSRDRRERAYRGERLRGNLLPDIFVNVFRDADATASPGMRVVRIATHPAVRHRGLASALLGEIRREMAEELAYVGTSFGATPGLVRFWANNGFVPVALSASRNRTSGAYSVVMLDASFPGTPAFVTEYAAALPGRLRASLSDIHRDVEPDTVVEILQAIPTGSEPQLEPAAWRRLVAAADGPGRYDMDPGPARQLAVHHLTSSTDSAVLSDAQHRLLVAKVLQGRAWERVVDELEYHSVSESRRALGAALAALVDEHGGDVAHSERRALDVSKNTPEATEP